MSGERTASEARLETYLTEHRYEFEHHPDLGESLKRPDYLVSEPAAGAEAVVEVKEFTTTRITDRLAGSGGYASLGPKEVYGAVRGAVDEAADQLRPFRGQGRPLVIALANPHFADVHLSFEYTLQALYGNPGYSIPIDRKTGAAAGKGAPFLGRDGALTAKHAYISAVLIVHERDLRGDWSAAKMKEFDDLDQYAEYAAEADQRGEVPTGTRRHITTIHTITAATGEAKLLPDEFFDAPDDRAWAYKPEDGAYILTRGEQE